jgi:hypothetical protein
MTHSKAKLVPSVVKAFVTGIIVSLLLMITMSPAVAMNSAIGSISVVNAPNGYIYCADNIISTYLSSGVKYANAMTSVWEKDRKTVPSGYVGVCPRLYDDAGNLKSTITWFYIGTGTTELCKSYLQSGASGPRVSNGLQKTWIGTEYWTHATFPSPASSIYN